MKRMERDVFALVFGAADTTKTANFDKNGWIEMLILKVPTFTNAVTVTKIEFLDRDGDVIYTNSTGWALNANYLIGTPEGTSVNIPIDVSHHSTYYQVKVTLSGAPGGSGGTITVKTFMKADW